MIFFLKSYKIIIFLTFFQLFYLGNEAQFNKKLQILKGRIKSEKPQWLVFTYWGLNKIDIDSVFLKSGYNFINFKGLNTNLADENIYTLTFRGEIAQLWFHFDNDTITVDLDTEKPLNHIAFDAKKSVMGSPATIEYYERISWALKHFNKRIIGLKNKQDSIEDEYPRSSEINELDTKIKVIIKAKDDYYMNWAINTNFSCNAAIAIIELSFDKSDLSPYIWLADTLEKRFPKSYFVKEQVRKVRQNAISISQIASSGLAPTFELTNKNNQMVSLSNYRGKYVLIDFWASWCAPCIKEMPQTIEIQNKYASKGFKVLSISIDKDKQAWLKAIEKHQMQNLVNLHDEKGEAAKAYHVSYVPLTILVDPKGEIIGSNLHGEELEKKLAEIYNE
ncbi:MAG: TlpA disulfide reductase family protein [Bacteroidales bacterium]|nr:TlpA disulfide reductase family protein [Bacteroidales bacterium]